MLVTPTPTVPPAVPAVVNTSPVEKLGSENTRALANPTVALVAALVVAVLMTADVVPLMEVMVAVVGNPA